MRILKWISILIVAIALFSAGFITASRTRPTVSPMEACLSDPQIMHFQRKTVRACWELSADALPIEREAERLTTGWFMSIEGAMLLPAEHASQTLEFYRTHMASASEEALEYTRKQLEQIPKPRNPSS